MEDDWQKLADDDAVPVAPKVVIPADVNKWAGEDEDEVKDSWDADDDEKEDEEKTDNSQPIKPKKTIKQKIAEKEQQRLELEEKRRKEKEEEDMAHMTPEQRAAEKLRLKQLQEEADTKLALDSLGLNSASNLDSLNPKTKEEFAEFATAISKTITQFKAEEEYVPFLDELVSRLCAGLSSTNIRKIKTSLENLHLEKSKIEKGDKPKKKAGPKVKARLRIEGDDDYSSRAGAYEADDYDDFM